MTPHFRADSWRLRAVRVLLWEVQSAARRLATIGAEISDVDWNPFGGDMHFYISAMNPPDGLRR
jgi:hypothetical protein